MLSVAGSRDVMDEVIVCFLSQAVVRSWMRSLCVFCHRQS